mmetsp:Transcript_15289/g.38684  ORF Transcript_15289/g.38684 Transcript_15289/m.38684 type:complete len:237 (-) Transcript_15289:435-1145(-)
MGGGTKLAQPVMRTPQAADDRLAGLRADPSASSPRTAAQLTRQAGPKSQCLFHGARKRLVRSPALACTATLLAGPPRAPPPCGSGRAWERTLATCPTSTGTTATFSTTTTSPTEASAPFITHFAPFPLIFAPATFARTAALLPDTLRSAGAPGTPSSPPGGRTCASVVHGALTLTFPQCPVVDVYLPLISKALPGSMQIVANTCTFTDRLVSTQVTLPLLKSKFPCIAKTPSWSRI